MRIKLTTVEPKWANKDGQPYLDKNSRPYARVGIKTEQHGKTWLSGFAYQDSPILKWKAGDEAEIDIEQNGKYLNFRLPRVQKPDGVWNPELVSKLFTALQRIEDKVDNLELVEPPLEASPDEFGKDELPNINKDEPPF